MNTGHLTQGQAITALGQPDYNAEGAQPWRVGFHGVASITVSQLAGPMGWYDVAVIKWDNGRPDQLMPLHHCDYIAI
jgi:hypothetical protein